MKFGSITDGYGNAISGSGGGGWTTALNLDFTTQGTQTLSSNTTYTIGGVTWNKINTANEASATILNSNGLTFNPLDNSADFVVGGNSCPGIWTSLTSLIPNLELTMSLRLSFYIKPMTLGGGYDSAVVGLDSASHGGVNSLAIICKRGFTTGSPGNQLYWFLNNSNLTGYGIIAPVTTPATDTTTNVVQLYLSPTFAVYPTLMHGPWSSGINQQSMKFAINYGANTSFGFYDPTDMRIFLGAQRPTAPGGTCSVPFGALKVEYKY